MAMWLLRSISGEEPHSGTSAPAPEGAQHFSLSDEVQDDGQELEAEYDFEAFNKKTPAEVSDSAVQESRDAVSESTAPPAAEGDSLRLARCLQALRQLEGGLQEAHECAAAAKTADFADFSRLHQVLQQQHELVACTLREVTPEDSNEKPMEKRMAQLEALATDYPVLEEQVNQLAAIAEELTDALEVSKAGEEQLEKELFEAKQRLQQVEECSSEDTKLRAELAKATEELSAERAHVRELQLRIARVEVEWNLEQALKKKGRSYNFRHFDI